MGFYFLYFYVNPYVKKKKKKIVAKFDLKIPVIAQF